MRVRYARAALLGLPVVVGLVFAVAPCQFTHAADRANDAEAEATEVSRDALRLHEQGRHAEAEALARRALAITEAAVGDEHALTANRHKTLATVLQAGGRHAEAEQHFRRALAIKERALGPEHVFVAIALDDLALLLREQGRPAEAETLLRRALLIRERARGPDHRIVADSLENLAMLIGGLGRTAEAETLRRRARGIVGQAPAAADAIAGAGNTTPGDLPRQPSGDPMTMATELAREADRIAQQGKYAEAEGLLREALRLRIDALGEEHPDVADNLSILGDALHLQGRYAEAEAMFRRAIGMRERLIGPAHLDTATSLSGLAKVLYSQGRYADAEPLARKSLAVYEEVLGPNHPATATRLNLLGLIQFSQDRLADAESIFRRVADAMEAAFGSTHRQSAVSLNNLALVLQKQGRFAEAEPLTRQVVEANASALGAGHPNTLLAVNNLAHLLIQQGRYNEAEPLLLRVLTAYQGSAARDHDNATLTLANLVAVLNAQGRHAEAEPHARRALELSERTLGAEHPQTASSVEILAELLHNQGRQAEAELLIRRAVAIRERASGPAHSDTANSLVSLSLMLTRLGRYGEAEPLLRRALSIWEKTGDAEHPNVALGLNALAILLYKMKRHAEAETMFRNALAIAEHRLGPEHMFTATVLNNLAMVLEWFNLLGEAEAQYTRALAILQKAFGSEHPSVATGYSNLADVYEAQRRLPRAIEAHRRAVNILERRFTRPETGRSGAMAAERRDNRSTFLDFVRILATQATGPDGHSASTVEEAFRAMQLAGGTETARAVSGMAARFAAGSDALAAAVRERQDLLERWRALDRSIIAAATDQPDKRDPAAEAASRRALADTEARLGSLDARLASGFPRYAEVANPNAVSVAEVQKLLADDEVLVTWSVARRESFVLAVRKDRATFERVALRAADLKEAVAVLRSGLQPPDGGISLARPARFDVAAAHALYAQLFGPAEPLLDGARHVFVVPDGALQSLPLGVLVTARPQAPIRDFAGYAEVPWLARRFAITVLPAVSSLRALRLFATQAKASSPFAGFGDPLFDGMPGGARSVRLAGLFRGGLGDVAEVRQLARLPNTAEELRAQARALKAPDLAVRLGALASETEVKRTDLSAVRVLTFATHGLVSGEIKGLAEPALALTPPREATAEDDGLLTASEVAQLKLNADWVVLSACNTAAPDGTEGAEGLSGLAKAFFYAGARSLLVSHWPVETDAAVALTTGAFDALERDPGIGRAEALRRSMLAMIEKAKSDAAAAHLAHPMFWAPFVLVGEGAAGR